MYRNITIILLYDTEIPPREFSPLLPTKGDATVLELRRGLDREPVRIVTHLRTTCISIANVSHAIPGDYVFAQALDSR